MKKELKILIVVLGICLLLTLGIGVGYCIVTKDANKSSDVENKNDNSQVKDNKIEDREKLTADDVTWSITKNGALSGVIAKATQNIHYNGEGTFYPSSGAFVIEPVTEPGNYTINWTSTDGLMCSQNVIVVE